MKLGPGDRAIFSRSEEEEETAGRKVGGREGPKFLVRRIVGQSPARQVDRRGGDILEFNPVREVPVRIGECEGVGGHEFRYDHRRIRLRLGEQQQPEDKECAETHGKGESFWGTPTRASVVPDNS